MSERLVDVSRWYAVHTKPKQEDRVDDNLRAWKVETFSPKLKQYRSSRYTGERTYVTKPLFTGYIFARFEAVSMLHKIFFTRGVQSVVCSDGVPVPIPDDVIELIQSQVREDGYIRIGEKFKPGDKVMIKEGPFKSWVGIFEREMKDQERVMILLALASYQGRIIIDRARLGRAL